MTFGLGPFALLDGPGLSRSALKFEVQGFQRTGRHGLQSLAPDVAGGAGAKPEQQLGVVWQ